MKKKKVSKKRSRVSSGLKKSKKENVSSHKKISVRKKSIKKKVTLKVTKKVSKRKTLKSASRKKKLSLKQKAVFEPAGNNPVVYPVKISSEEFSSRELPRFYGKDFLKLLVRDPWCVYAYWEVTPSTFDKFTTRLQNKINNARLILRVYDVTGIIFNGNNANKFFDLGIDYDVLNWYINTNSPGLSFCVELGFLLEDGEFVVILRSNTVNTPLDRPSSVIDEKWMFPKDLFNILYKMSFGFHGSSPVGDLWSERLRLDISSGIFSVNKSL